MYINTAKLTNIFEGLVEFRKVSEDILHHLRRPIIYLGACVCISTYYGFYAFFDDCAHLIHDKLVLLKKIKISYKLISTRSCRVTC